MSVGFGFSVGDFLAALQLVSTVIDAIRESSHTSASFRSLLIELYTLESALLRVKRLDIDDCHHVDKLALRQAASQCQRTIDSFWGKMQKYQPHLQQSGSGSRLKDSWAKIKWVVCKKDDLAAFQAQIRGHTSSIEILLLAVHMEVATIDARRQESQQMSLAGRIQDLSCQAMIKLNSIAESVAQNVRQGKKLLELSSQIIQTNLRVFELVHDIQLFIFRIPDQVQRQQPVHLIDAFNRETPFHLEFVRSAEALLAVLKVNFKQTGCGPEMIDRGEFTIEELGTRKPIDITRAWDSCFYPGQKVAMSMVFKLPETIKSTCPACGEAHDGSTGKEIMCNTCGTVFCRIVDVYYQLPALYSLDQGTERSYDKDDGEECNLLDKKKEYDISTNLRKFRRLRIVSPLIINFPWLERPIMSSCKPGAYWKTWVDGKSTYYCLGTDCRQVFERVSDYRHHASSGRHHRH